MDTEKSCDLCDRTEADLPHPTSADTILLTIDEDGLWICYLCRAQITSTPVSDANNTELDDALKPLVGKSAGAICRTSELPFEPPFQSVIEAASKIAYDQDLYMSAWLFAEQWLDGTSVWRSEDGKQTALVTTEGKVQIEHR